MKTIFTIGGFGLLAYALYEWWLSQQAPASAGTATAFTPGASASTGSPAPQPPKVVINAAVLVSAAAGDPAVINGLATSYVWNFYYSQLSGVKQTFTPPNPTAMISAATYLALRASAGLSGFARGNANFNPYTLRPPLAMSRMVH